jgi:hypothetical protein
VLDKRYIPFAVTEVLLSCSGKTNRYFTDTKLMAVMGGGDIKIIPIKTTTTISLDSI